MSNASKSKSSFDEKCNSPNSCVCLMTHKSSDSFTFSTIMVTEGHSSENEEKWFSTLIPEENWNNNLATFVD